MRVFARRRPRRSDGTPVLRAVSGVGAERAYRAGRRLLEAGATALVSWGTAGALVPELGPGALLLPRKVIGCDGTDFPVDSDWHQRVSERLPRELAVHMAPLADAAEPLLSAIDKSRLAQRSGADAADMESAALAALAREAGVPIARRACGYRRCGRCRACAPRDGRTGRWRTGRSFDARVAGMRAFAVARRF